MKIKVKNITGVAAPQSLHFPATPLTEWGGESYKILDYQLKILGIQTRLG